MIYIRCFVYEKVNYRVLVFNFIYYNYLIFFLFCLIQGSLKKYIILIIISSFFYLKKLKKEIIKGNELLLYVKIRKMFKS